MRKKPGCKSILKMISMLLTASMVFCLVLSNAQPLFFASETNAVGYTETILNNCDSINGWNVVDGPGNTAIDTVDKQEGTGAFRFYDTPEGMVGEISKNLFFEQPQDLSVLNTDTQKALQLWIKVSDVSALNQLCIDVVDAEGMSGTSLTWDWGHMKRYEFSASRFQSGQWVKLYIRPTDSNYQHGAQNAPDYSKIKMISVKVMKSASLPLSVSVDNVAVVDTRFDYGVDDCDSLDGWTSSSGWMQLRTSGMEEGSGAISISNNVPNPTNIISKAFATSINMSSITRENDKQLEFWVKVDNPWDVDTIRVDLASSQGVDASGNFTWNFGKAWTIRGAALKDNVWQKITINKNTEVNHEWGTIDYSDIKYISIQVNTKNNGLVDVMVDDIRLADVGSTYILDDGSDIKNWKAEPWRGTITAGGAGHDGGASIKILDTNPAVPHYQMAWLPKAPVDLTKINSTHDKELTIWMKVSNAAALTNDGVYIILGSEGCAGADGLFDWQKGKAVRYQFPKAVFTDNEWVKLTINSLTPVNHDWGGFDLSKTVLIQPYIPLQGVMPEVWVSEISLSDRIEKAPPVILEDNCDKNNGWVEVSGQVKVDSNAAEGRGAVMLYGAPSEALVMNKVLDNATNLNGLNVRSSKILSFWIKVNDVSKLKALNFDLVGKEDMNEDGSRNWVHMSRWVFNPQNLESGKWVKVQLTGFDSNMLPSPKLSNYANIKMIAVNAQVAQASDYLEVSFDDFKYEDCPVYLEDKCDTNNGWIATQGTVATDKTAPKEGEGNLLLSGAPAEALAMGKTMTLPQDVSGMGIKNSKALTLWVKITDVSKIKKFQIDLVDVSGLDANGAQNWTGMKRWEFAPDQFKSGEWVKIQLTDFDWNIFNVWNNTLDYSKIKFISVSAYVLNKDVYAEVGIDDIRYEDYVDNSPKLTVEDNCDANNGWIATQGTVTTDKTAPKEGAGNLLLSGAPAEALAMAKTMTLPQDIAGMGKKNNKALTLWVKITDVSKIKKFQIDLVDESGLDANGAQNWTGMKRWEFAPNQFESGEWVKLQLTDFDWNIFNVWNNTLDYSNIKFMSILAFVSEKDVYAEVAIDNIRYEDYVDNGEKITVDDNCDVNNGWIASLGDIKIDTQSPKAGTGSLAIYGSPDEALIMKKSLNITDSLSGLDIPDYRKLTLWVRVKDVSKLTELNIDLVSTGGLNADGQRNWSNCKRWIFTADKFKNGEWVKIEITGNDKNMEKDWEGNTIDYDNIVQIQVSAYVPEKNAYLEIAFDEFKVEVSPEKPEIPGDTDSDPIENQDITKPVVKNAAVAKVLNYKIVVAPKTTLKKLIDSVQFDEGYQIRVVDKNNNPVEGKDLLKTGMWMIISKDNVDVATYYIEIGDPKNTSNIKDIPMSNRPNSVDTSNTPTGENNMLSLAMFGVIIPAGCILLSKYTRKRVHN